MNVESIIFFNLLIYLVGFVLLLSLNDSIFKEMSGWISLVISILGIIFSSSIQFSSSEIFLMPYNWLHVGNTQINFTILVDNQTYFMYVLVQIIAFFVNLFSTKYLDEDPGVNRFFAFINLFVFSMLGMVIAGNLLQLYFFWELVGFCSYLLIGFWYTKKSANSASLKAFLINRIGDGFLLIGIFLIYLIYGSLEFGELLIPKDNIFGFPFLTANGLQTLAVLMIFGGVMAKSAQLPLQIWLPDAMEGPTPASALIHAATMVVAGVFLLGRISSIITEEAGIVIALIGGLTSVLAAISAIFQYDIKKVLAYSTISQLGFMVTGMGIGAVGASLFHLATHAFFKAGLFLCAGAVINYLHHEQDMRKMGNLTRKTPVVFYSYIICAGALIGLPFTSGFLSKEALLTEAISFGLSHGYYNIRFLVPILMGITSFLTSFYVIRQLVMVFFERQDNPMEKIFDSTKRTVGGAIKSFQDILNADNESLGEDRVINFIRNLGIFDVVVLSLAVCSTYFIFSSSPFLDDSVWFLKVFGETQDHYKWLPWAVGVIFILALLISYNTTYDEIRMYYFQEKPKGWRRKLYLVASNHFYIDKFFKKIVHKLLLGIPTVSFEDESTDNIKRSAFAFNGFSHFMNNIETKVIDNLIKKITSGFLYLSFAGSIFEEKIIDAAVMNVSGGLSSLGNKIRKAQSGQLQYYVLGMLLVISTIVLIIIL